MHDRHEICHEVGKEASQGIRWMRCSIRSVHPEMDGKQVMHAKTEGRQLFSLLTSSDFAECSMQFAPATKFRIAAVIKELHAHMAVSSLPSQGIAPATPQDTASSALVFIFMH